MKSYIIPFKYARFQILGPFLTPFWNKIQIFFVWHLNTHYLYVFHSTAIGDVMVSVLTSSAIDREFEPLLGQTKDYKIGICFFSAKHAVLRRKSKDWLAWNQNNVSEWSDMSTRGLLFQWASTINIQLGVLV